MKPDEQERLVGEARAVAGNAEDVAPPCAADPTALPGRNDRADGRRESTPTNKDCSVVSSLETDLLRVTLAKQAISRAMGACDYILSEVKSPDHPVYEQLVTAICVLYVRPFGKSNEVIGALPDEFGKFSDSRKQTLHDMLRLSRVKFFAHTDCGIQYFNRENEPVEHILQVGVVAVIGSDGTISLRTQTVEPQLLISQIPEIRELCQDLLHRLSTEENRLLEALAAKVPLKETLRRAAMLLRQAVHGMDSASAR